LGNDGGFILGRHLGDRVHGKRTVIRKEPRSTLFIYSGPLLVLHVLWIKNWQIFNHLLERAKAARHPSANPST
jgi:hypothetical protein